MTLSASSAGEPVMLSHDEFVREWADKPLSLIVARSVMRLAEDKVAETPQIVADFETQGLLRRLCWSGLLRSGNVAFLARGRWPISLLTLISRGWLRSSVWMQARPDSTRSIGSS